MTRSVGTGTILPGTKHVNTKKSSKAAPDAPTFSKAQIKTATEAVRRTQNREREHRFRVELVFEGPLAHLLQAVACQDQKTPADWCQDIIRDSVNTYMEDGLDAEKGLAKTAAQGAEEAEREAVSEARYELHGNAAATAAAQVVEFAVQTDRFLVLLSKPASDLVRWYCALMHHKPAFAIEGILHDALDRAKDAYEGAFTDDSFDFVVASTLAAITLNHFPDELVREGSSTHPRII